MELQNLLKSSQDTDKTLNLILSEISYNYKPEYFFIFLESSQETCILKKKSDKVLDVILEILKNSKKMLKMGSNLQENRNFTTITLRISRIILELHEFLQKESTLNSEIFQILIENTNYSSLQQGSRLLEEIVSMIYRILDQDFSDVSDSRKGALKILVKILDKKVETVLQDLNFLRNIIGKLKKVQEISDIYHVVKGFIRNSKGNLEEIWEIIEDSQLFKVENPRFEKENLSVLLEFSKSLKENSLERIDEEFEVIWWLKNIEWVLALVNDAEEDVRCAALDVLSQISEKVFINIPSKLVFTLQSIGIGMLSDAKDTVRAAACGFLGVLITFDCVQKDLLFFSDLIGKIPRITMEDEALVVKVRSSWALANICAAFVEIRKKDLEEFSIPGGYLRKCVEAALYSSKDKEKVYHLCSKKCRSNGVRALGNIFHVLPNEWVHSEVEGLVKEIIEVLIKSINTGPVKVIFF